jgi:hypothetical protein
MADTWRDVAEALALRMEYQAFNCPVGTGVQPTGNGQWADNGEERHVPEEHPECPFCADTLAYKRFLVKKKTSR